MEYDFVDANSNGEVTRCMETEREALLKFKEGLYDKYGMMSSWGRVKECCEWEGIQCNSTTGHVIALQLAGNIRPFGAYFLQGNISSALLKLHNLNILNLSQIDFGGNKFPEFICSMSQLQHLNLASSNFSGTLPSEIGTLTHLHTLDLSSNHFFGTLPSEIGNLTNIETLYLMSNKFSGIVPPQLWSLTNLKDLDLSENNLTSSVSDDLFKMSTNHVAPSFRTLNLENNNLKRLPSSIWQSSNLEVLMVSFNSLEDTITEADLSKLPNLKVLELSFNSLTLNISPDWTPPFQLTQIDLSGCKVGPHFPLWLRNQNNFTVLDLSLTGISAEVPKWLWGLSDQVDYLNLSHNQLSGTVANFSSIRFIDLSSNMFSGPIPSLPPTTRVLQISQNMFSGSLSFNCVTSYYLMVLDLSNNRFEGKLPICWKKMQILGVLNLANNSFSGEIPHALGSLLILQTLHLANNKFSGEFPLALKNCQGLELIDIGGNMLTGSIPTLIGEYQGTIQYLILRNNRFNGSIPPQICYLSSIKVLDLSGNNLSGKIPPCFNNFIYLVDKANTSNEISRLMSFPGVRDIFKIYIERQRLITKSRESESTTVLWKRLESKYTRNLYLLKLIDLSHNTLDGDIPSSFSSLKELRSLNLSRNRLTGMIDPNIGQMGSLESLDLSSNQLFGVIPNGIVELNFLSSLDLANNNLSGEIPTGTQLQTFSATAYTGNIGLCGDPLPPCSRVGPGPSTNSEAQNVDKEDDDGSVLSLSFVKDPGFGISIILGLIFGFWGVVGSLTVNETWRRMFYIFWGEVGDWIYVRLAIFWRKLRRRSS